MNVEKLSSTLLTCRPSPTSVTNRPWERADRADRRLDRLEHIVTMMVRVGRPLRTDVRELQQWRAEVRHWQKKTEQNLSEITEKLDALIDIVSKSIRRNGGNGKRS